jgi:SAM-dependent methyltransferase
MASTETRTEEVVLAEYWSKIAPEFDSIYTGKKNPVARGLDRWLRKDIYQRYEWVMQVADQIRPATVCDVGCGSGRFVSSLAKRGAWVTGVDFAPEMLNLARKLVADEGVASRCRFVLSDILDWKSTDIFDMAIAIGFWDYVQDPMPRLKVIRKLTGSTFLSAWPRAGTLRMSIRKVRLKSEGCPVYFFEAAQVENYLKQAGFRIDGYKVLGQLHCFQASVA